MTTMEKKSLEAFDANNLEKLHLKDEKLTADIREKLAAKFPLLAADIFDANNEISTKIKVEKGSGKEKSKTFLVVGDNRMEVGGNDQEAGELVAMLIELQKLHESHEEEVDAIITAIKPELESLITQLSVDANHTHSYTQIKGNDVGVGKLDNVEVVKTTIVVKDKQNTLTNTAPTGKEELPVTIDSFTKELEGELSADKKTLTVRGDKYTVTNGMDTYTLTNPPLVLVNPKLNFNRNELRAKYGKPLQDIELVEVGNVPIEDKVDDIIPEKKVKTPEKKITTPDVIVNTPAKVENQKPQKKQPEMYEGQEGSTQINYQLKGHEFVLSGERFDITTDAGIKGALALIVADGDTEKAKDFKKDFKKINVGGMDAIMAKLVAQWPSKLDKQSVKKIGKEVNYDRKGNVLFLDFNSDYKHFAKIFNALGKDGVASLYAARNLRIDVQEIANTMKDKKEGDLNKIDQTNVFDYIANRDSKNDDFTKAEKVKEKFSEKSLLDTLLDVGNREYTADKSKKILVDGTRTTQIIEGFIMHVEGRGKLPKGTIEAQMKEIRANEPFKIDPDVRIYKDVKYRLSTFALLIKNNPQYKVYYQNSLADWTANKKADLHDIVRADNFAKMLDKPEVEVEGVSQDFSFDGKVNIINDKQKAWFEGYLKNIKDPEAKKWFDGLDAKGKESFMYALTKVFKKTSLLTSAIGFKTQNGEPINEKNLMDAMKVDFKWLKDEGGKGIRIVPMFRFKSEKVYSRQTGQLIKEVKLPTDFFIGFDLPIVSAGFDARVNRGNLDRVGEDQVKSLNSVYGHLSAHVAAYINVGFDKKNLDYAKEFKDYLNIFEPQFGALAQADLGFKKDYNAGIEYVSNKFADRLGKIFTINGATSLEGVKAAFATNLESAKKEFKGYEKQNPGRMEQYQNLMLAMLQASPVFDYIKAHPEAAGKLDVAIKSLSKGLVSENEKEKMQAINGDTKLTKIGILGRAGLMFDLKQLAEKNGFADMVKNNAKIFGAGIQYSLTSFLIKYAPDKEKYEYMDESLKKGLDMNRIEGVNLASGVEQIAKDLTQSMNVDGLKITTDKGRLVFSLDPDHPATTSDGKAVTDIAKLLNIYVDATETNVAFSADGKSLIVGDTKALGYINRNYFNDQSHYLVIGTGGVEGKKRVHSATELPNKDVDVKEVRTDIYTDAALRKAVMEDPTMEGTPEDKKALAESIVPGYLKVDENTHKYRVLQNGNWVDFDHNKNGLSIVCDKAGKCESIEITDKIGKISFEQAEYTKDDAPKSADILSKEGKEIYDVIKNELFTNVDFGPLVSKYKHTDKQIQKLYADLVKTPHTTEELVALLKGVQKKITADNGKFVAGDMAKVNASIEKVIGKINGCNSLDCKLIVNVFLSKLPQSVGHAAKSGEFISGGKMEAIFSEGYSHHGKKLDAIKNMKLPEYVNTHINRVPAFTKVMQNAGLGKYTAEILKNRTSLLNKDPNATSWTVKPDANLLMFNANMTPGVNEFNLIPPGEAMVAFVGSERMISKVSSPALEQEMLAKLKADQYGGYKDLLEKKYPGITPEQVDEFIVGKDVTVGGKTFHHNGLGLVFGFYGGCFNESLGFDIGQIVEKVTVGALKGSITLKDIVGMKFNADAQTLTSTPFLESKTLTHTIGVDMSEKVRKTTSSSVGGGTGGGGGGGSGGGGNGGGDGGSGGGGGGNGGGGTGGGGGGGGGDGGGGSTGGG